MLWLSTPSFIRSIQSACLNPIVRYLALKFASAPQNSVCPRPSASFLPLFSFPLPPSFFFPLFFFTFSPSSFTRTVQSVQAACLAPQFAFAFQIFFPPSPPSFFDLTVRSVCLALQFASAPQNSSPPPPPALHLFFSPTHPSDFTRTVRSACLAPQNSFISLSREVLAPTCDQLGSQHTRSHMSLVPGSLGALAAPQGSQLAQA